MPESKKVTVEITGKTDPPGPEFMLFLVFDTGFQIDLPVTFYEPKFDNGRLVSAEIRQESLQAGETNASHIEWKRVIFAGVFSRNQAFVR